MKASLFHVVVACELLLPVVAVAGQAPGGSGPSVRDVVVSYLEGLKNLDQDQMNRSLADSATTRSLGGDESRIDVNASRRMRDFERGVNTWWQYTIVDVTGERVTVELQEGNDFYDLLGVGARTQTTHYFVGGGRIIRMETTARKHGSGDFASVYEAFKKWLFTTPAARDSRIAGDGVLIFDGDSARLLRRWLVRWAAERRPRDVSQMRRGGHRL